jgi:hypothetical protein
MTYIIFLIAFIETNYQGNDWVIQKNKSSEQNFPLQYSSLRFLSKAYQLVDPRLEFLSTE